MGDGQAVFQVHALAALSELLTCLVFSNGILLRSRGNWQRPSPRKKLAIQKLRDTVSGTEGFIAKVKRYTDITELTSELLRLFIQKIVVHEKSTKWSKHALQTIEIHYNDIGCIGGDVQQEKKSPRQELSA